ncbi:MAG TPA: hypothetical protein VHP14_02600 [Anaerolineales bacterium]|nr:hypothetical protein [Anaerolineales bacterium]
MSKPIARVTVFVLISLALIAATSVGVRGWLNGADRQATGAHTVGGLQTDFNHQRSTVAELESRQLYNQPSGVPQQSGGCHSEGQFSPDD